MQIPASAHEGICVCHRRYLPKNSSSSFFTYFSIYVNILFEVFKYAHPDKALRLHNYNKVYAKLY